MKKRDFLIKKQDHICFFEKPPESHKYGLTCYIYILYHFFKKVKLLNMELYFESYDKLQVAGCKI